ncbi:MAG: sulfotransferase family protein [Streptosporangiaceae bacterium]
MTDHRPQRSPGILAMWSAPRSRSTAFARMMAERGDYTVLHEPFSHVIDFGESAVGERLARTEDELIDAIWEFAASRPVFFKDTTDFHYPRMLADKVFLAGPTHTFIIRHPAQAIASHYALNPQLGRDEIGFAWLAEIYDTVAAATGTAPVVIEADDLVERPAETVRAYCEAVRIPFLPEALSWPPGMADQWRRTSRWHESTSRTSGFASSPSPSGSPGGSPRTGPDLEKDPVLSGYLAYHLPYYERLRAVAIKP